MLIHSVTPYLFEAPLEAPISDARNTITHRSCVLVEIKTDEGIKGWGEAASFAGCGALVSETIKFFGERLRGQDPSFISGIFDASYHSSLHFGRRGLVVSALSGIDIALWDIMGQVAGMPIYKLLGAARENIKFYFNGGYFVAEDNLSFLERSVTLAVDRGAGALKIKIGRFGIDDDTQRIKLARSILGPDRDLMVDANGVLDQRYLLQLDPVMVEHKVRWIEEPVSLRRVELLRRLADRLITPIAGYELEMTLQGYSELIEAGAVSVVQPDAIWSGGITECHRIGAVAQAHEIEFVPHNFATIVSLAANAQLGASLKMGGWLEVDSNVNPFLWDLDKNQSYFLDDGAIALPERSGLGLDIDLSIISKYRKK